MAHQNFCFCFIDLNTATEEEISSIPLVGPERARELIERRPYRSIEEVKVVPGMSDVQLHALIEAGAVVGPALTAARA